MAEAGDKRTDIELLRRSATGDEAAFIALYDRYQKTVHRFALYCSGSAELAEEITQEVFLLLIRSPQLYDVTRQSSLPAYLCGVARNHLRNTGSATKFWSSWTKRNTANPRPRVETALWAN
jgi:RNA polymerase sigma-70 factor (ECF subfamily)